MAATRAPAQDNRNPELLRPGRSHEGMLLQTTGDAEPLFSSYKIRSEPRKFFKIGTVFLVLWAEPAGGNATTFSTGTTVGQYGERVYSSVRRFVVIREGGTLQCLTNSDLWRSWGRETGHQEV